MKGKGGEEDFPQFQICHYTTVYVSGSAVRPSVRPLSAC